LRGSKIRINRAGLLSMLPIILGPHGALCATIAKRDPALAYVFAVAPRYEPAAWVEGRDRFPMGAKLFAVKGGMPLLLAPGFYGAADPAISYDGARVLFSGKRAAGERWQIWEVDLQDGAPRQLTRCESDCVRPLYLPDGGFVYSRGDRLEISGKTGRLTFAPGRYLTDDVLRDGRILYESTQGTRTREIFTVYPDGTGVESLRCDHGPDRGDARQLASGDTIFVSGGRLARFTSALAQQADVPQPPGEAAGPIAEIAAGAWLVSLRGRSGNAGLYYWKAATRVAVPLEVRAGASVVEPAVIAPRTPPRQFPSALVPARTAGNLLCLNARASRTPMNGASARMVKAYTPAGLLGQTPVEPDGSFYIQVPADRPIRLELADAAGQVVQAEHHWFWMRPAEQRICVGCHMGPERAPENKVPEILLKTIVPIQMLEVQP
jgi:hypothetical protein